VRTEIKDVSGQNIMFRFDDPTSSAYNDCTILTIFDKDGNMIVRSARIRKDHLRRFVKSLP
jgi:hypothetical protein